MDRNIISGGSALSNDNKTGLVMLEIWEEAAKVDIRELDSSPSGYGFARYPILNQTTAPNVLVGDPINSDPKYYPNPVEQPRTIAGVIDNQKLAILVSKSSTIPNAVQTLIHTFNVNSNKLIALDGGGSSQLLAINANKVREYYIDNKESVVSRAIPQTIGVISGTVDPIVDPTTLPSISYISPKSGIGGQLLTIYGSKFGPMRGSVSFGSYPPATIKTWTDNKIEAVIPNIPSCTYVNVFIETAGGLILLRHIILQSFER